MDDLVKRLRENSGYEHQDPIWKTRLEAADRIEADAKRIEGLINAAEARNALLDDQDKRIAELSERVKALSWMGEGYALVERRAEAAEADLRLERHRLRTEADLRNAAEARVKELEAALTDLLRAWDEVCKVIPALVAQPEAIAARAAIEGEKT